MELRLLKTFLAAAQQESFTRAAEELELTQAAVSLSEGPGIRPFQMTRLCLLSKNTL